MTEEKNRRMHMNERGVEEKKGKKEKGKDDETVKERVWGSLWLSG